MITSTVLLALVEPIALLGWGFLLVGSAATGYVAADIVRPHLQAVSTRG